MLLMNWPACPQELWMCICVASNGSHITYQKGEFFVITSVLCFDKPFPVLMHKSKHEYTSLSVGNLKILSLYNILFVCFALLVGDLHRDSWNAEVWGFLHGLLVHNGKHQWQRYLFSLCLP